LADAVDWWNCWAGKSEGLREQVARLERQLSVYTVDFHSMMDHAEEMANAIFNVKNNGGEVAPRLFEAASAIMNCDLAGDAKRRIELEEQVARLEKERDAANKMISEQHEEITDLIAVGTKK
jgi:chromosome segregation ATPase